MEERQAELEAFLSAFAEQAKSGNNKNLVPFFHIPTVFVEDDKKKVCLTEEDIVEQLDYFLVPTIEVVHGHYEPEITQIIPLAKEITFAQVNWSWTHDNGNEKRGRMISYTLQKGGVHGFDIVVTVNDCETRVESK